MRNVIEKAPSPTSIITEVGLSFRFIERILRVEKAFLLP